MTEPRKFSILIEQLGIKPLDIIKYISGGNGELPDLLIDMAATELKRISKESTQMAYHIIPAKLGTGNLYVNDIRFDLGKEVFEMLKGINSVAVFVCTLSPHLDTKLHQYTKPEEMTEAYIADIIGTLVIEKSLELIYQELQIQAKKTNLSITNTISPGNCGWAVEEQKKLFKLLPDNCLGITLNESGMMQPVKSLSGIVGIGEQVRFTHTDCTACSSKNCLYRKQPVVV